MKTKVTKEQISFIKENYSTKGGRYCAESIGLLKSTISSIANRLGIKVDENVMRKNMSKSIINIDDYKNVTDPNIAYILGLIWTDGCVIFSNNASKTPVIKHVCVLSDSFSSDLIFNALNWRNFKSENKKSIGKNTMSTSWISSRDLGDYLIENNYRDKNKGTCIYNNFKSLTSHFLRGVLDGDGCITISNAGKKYKQTAVYFSSSVDQDWTFLSDILDEICIKHKIRKMKDIRGESSQLCIHDSVSIYNLCEFIYKSSEGIRLERKYNKYLEFLEYKKVFKRNNKLKVLLDEN
jgi:hypothetical protein